MRRGHRSRCGCRGFYGITVDAEIFFNSLFFSMFFDGALFFILCRGVGDIRASIITSRSAENSRGVMARVSTPSFKMLRRSIIKSGDGTGSVMPTPGA